MWDLGTPLGKAGGQCNTWLQGLCLLGVEGGMLLLSLWRSVVSSGRWSQDWVPSLFHKKGSLMARCEESLGFRTIKESVWKTQQPWKTIIIAAAALTPGPSISVAAALPITLTAPGCSPACVSLACVLAALPEPNFILVGFSNAGFAQVVWLLKYLFCRPFAQRSSFYSE